MSSCMQSRCIQGFLTAGMRNHSNRLMKSLCELYIDKPSCNLKIKYKQINFINLCTQCFINFFRIYPFIRSFQINRIHHIYSSRNMRKNILFEYFISFPAYHLIIFFFQCIAFPKTARSLISIFMYQTDINRANIQFHINIFCNHFVFLLRYNTNFSSSRPT